MMKKNTTFLATAFTLMLTASLNAQTCALPIYIHPTGGSNPNYFTELNGKLYFQANNGTDGMELWVTDGTESGTQMVKNISLSGGSHPRYFKEYNGKLYFWAVNDDTRSEERRVG